jgi:hypothetical protein
MTTNTNASGPSPNGGGPSQTRVAEPNQPASGLSVAWTWYTRNFLRGFCYYLPLLLLFLLPLAVLYGSLGADYGPRLLFLHDDPLKQFVAGVGLGLFWAEVLFVGYLLWMRDEREGILQTWFTRSVDRRPESGQYVPSLSFVGYAGTVILCMLATGAVFGIIYWVSSAAFDVFPLPSRWTWADLFGRFTEPLWLYLGVITAIGLLVGLAYGFPALMTLGRSLAHRFGYQREAAASGQAVPAEPQPSPDAPSDPWMLRVFRWPSGLLILAAWVWALVLVWGWAPWGWKLVISFGLMLLGFFLTGAASLTDPGRDGRWRFPPGLFWVAFGANLLFGYAFASWCVSNCPYGLLAGLLAATGWGALLALATRLFCPTRWKALGTWHRDALGKLSPPERGFLARGVLFAVVSAIVLLTVPFFPTLNSPAHLATLLLFGTVALYGLFTYLIRRSLVLVLSVLALVAAVSHIQPYQMRLPALSYDHDVVLELEKGIAADVARQARFEDCFQKYQKTEDRLADNATTIKDYENTNAVITDPDLIAKNESELERLRHLRRQLETERQIQIALVQAAWQETEQKNRVRAARLGAQLRRDNLQLHLDEGGGDLSLLRTGDLDFLPTALTPHEPEPLVVIAISGGGIRAAVWAFHVLTRLELEFAKNGIDFPSHVRLITGASGGMLGAAYYVTTLPDPEQRHPKDGEWRCQRAQTLDNQQRRLESSDYLTPLAQRLVFNDIPGWLSPWPARMDRGQALEQAWNYYLKKNPNEAPGTGQGALDVRFDDLRQDERMGKRPSLVFTPMMIEDGRRLIISNLDLRWVISNDGRCIPSHTPPGEGTPANPGGPRAEQYGYNHSIEALELFRLFPPARKKLTVAMAVRMSASFSYFSPAVSLPTAPRRRVVDAGYYDNYGVSLTAAWLLDQENQDWIKKKSVRRVLFIQIRDGVTEQQRQLKLAQPDHSDSVSRSCEELTSPIEGMSNARVSSSSFRNDGQLKLLGQVEKLREMASHGVDRRPDPRLTYETEPSMVANFECEADVSLSWYLSKREQSDINQSGREIDANFYKILRWWSTKELAGQ